MVVMRTEEALLPLHREWTVQDLQDLPDDGLQYELVDGVLLVTPPPTHRHQRALGELYLAFRQHCPPELEVLFSPIAFEPTNRRSVQPDLLVLPRVDGDPIPTPVLVCEVLSPSTRVKDRTIKRQVYADAGVASYWLVDVEVPSVTILRLVSGDYVVEREVAREQRLVEDVPFRIELVPDELA
jgi:Uma2 family endonuclease